jgi:glyoxylase-like metal-dependent hydrolase (beta-lactamase superfamily II)
MTDALRHTPVRPVTFRFPLGSTWVSTILDGRHLRDAVRPPFMMDKSDAELAAIASEAAIPHDRMEHTYTPVLIDTGHEVVLIDTGFGPGGRTQGAGMLRAGLARLGYAPEDIDVVAFTHVHPDHILGVMEGDAPAYPNARYVIGRVEYDAWHSGAGIPESRAANRDMFLKLIVPLADRMTFVSGGDSIGTGIVAEEAFGHSAGHMMYRVTSGGKEVLIWGDVTNHYAFSLAHPESPVAFDDDKPAAIATRKRVLSMVADAQTPVIGHHMPFPALGRVERRGDSFAWVAATYGMFV